MRNYLKKLWRLMVHLLCALGRLFKGSVSNVLLGHFAFLLSQWDPVQSLGVAGRRHSSNGSNFFAIICILATSAYGIVGLHCEATGTLDWARLPLSPYIFTHQIFPQTIWKQADVITGADICTTITVFLSLLVVRPISEPFILFLNEEKELLIGGKVLNRQDTDKLLRLRKLLKNAIFGILHFFSFMIWVFFLVNLHRNGVYQISVPSVLYWAVGLPLFIIHIIYGIASALYIVLACQYITILQRPVLEQFNQLNAQLIRSSSLTRKPTWRLFQQYRALNSSIVSISTYTAEYCRYCSPFISLLYPFFILIFCYLLAVIVLLPTAFETRCIFIFAIFECNLFLISLTHQCASIVKLNGAFERANQVFAFVFTRLGAFKRLSPGCHLLAERLQSHGRLRSFTFKLLATYRITSKTHFMILSNVSIYFMFLVKDFYKLKVDNLLKNEKD